MTTVHTLRFWTVSLAILALFAAPVRAQEPEPPVEAEEAPKTVFDTIQWQHGPGAGELGTLAAIDIPEGYIFCGKQDTQTLMTAFGNPVSNRELGFLAPESRDWFVVFEFSDIGYVKDEEKSSLDAAAILTSIQEGNEQGNEIRRKNGWPELKITGWEVPPRFDDQTKNLEWAIRGETVGEGGVVNYNVRVLGRGGVMELALVLSPEKLPAVLPTFRQVVGGFAYKEGNRYAEYRDGDKLAAVGLTALIAGGGVAVLAKTGILQKLLKPILIGLLAIGAAIKSFFQKIFGGGKKAADGV